MVLADSHKIPRVPCYLGVQFRKSHHLSSTGLAPSVVCRSRTIRLGVTFVTSRLDQHSSPTGSHNTGRTTRAGFHAARFRLIPVRSPLLRKSLLLYVPEATKMVQFASLALTQLCIHRAVIRFCRIGFPHSDISGSKVVCTSPELIAACHVLHRLPTPRHPPYALSNLILKTKIP